MSGAEAALTFFFLGGSFWVLRPLVGALAKRVAGEAGRVPSPDELAALRLEGDVVAILPPAVEALAREAPRT